MKFLCLALGSYGDVLPLAGLARECHRRGHEVIFFTNPHYASDIQKTGVNFIPVGSVDEYEAFINDPRLWNPYKGRKVAIKFITQSVQKTYDILKEHVTPGQTILISSFLGWAARLIQEAHGIPLVSAYYAPSNFFSGYETPQGPKFQIPSCFPPKIKWQIWRIINFLFIDPLIQPSVNGLRRKLNLPPASQFLHEWAPSPHLILGMFPDWFGRPQPDWPPNTVVTGFPLYDEVHDAELPESFEIFLEAYPDPIVCTLGSVNKHARTFFLESVKACQMLNRPGIVLTRFADQLPEVLPPSIQHFTYASLSNLLPRCSVLLHHGGIGTCAQAMRAGIPQLIHPLGFDQYDNADRLERLGIGATITGKAFNRDTLARQLQGLLDSTSIRDRCNNVSEWIQSSDGFADAYEVIAARLFHRLTSEPTG